MNHRRKLAVAAVAVAIVALVAAGTTYARSFSNSGSAAPSAIQAGAPDQSLGCGDEAAGEMHSTMRAGLAESLGLTADQLDQELSGGKTLEELAAEKGISNEELSQKMLDAMKTSLDRLISQDGLTQQQADAALDAAKKHMDSEHIASMGDMGDSMHDGGSDFDMGAMHGGAQGSGTGPMHGGDSSDMDSMHGGDSSGMDSMHGGDQDSDMGAMHEAEGAQDARSCHDGSDGGAGTSSVPSTKGMMGRSL